jgi:hypothetical protein
VVGKGVGPSGVDADHRHALVPGVVHDALGGRAAFVSRMNPSEESRAHRGAGGVPIAPPGLLHMRRKY